MTPWGPPVRPLALGVFTCIDLVLCWLWWQGVQVERHDLPDPCSYLEVGVPPLFSAVAAATDALPPDASDELTPRDSLLGKCTVSVGALAHRERWHQQLRSHLPQLGGKDGPGTAAPLGDLSSCPATSSSHGELLQWLTALHVVPLCPDAVPAARQVYRHLASLGEPHGAPSNTDATCIAIPVASVLEAAGREASSVSGSANALLAVNILPPPTQETASCASGPEALRASLTYTDAHAVEAGAVEGLSTLQLFVATQADEGAVPRLHIGAGSSMVLMIPKGSSSKTSKRSGSGSDQNDAALQHIAAEAATQALGRWLLSPLRGNAAISADLRLRLWVLGDVDREEDEDGDAYLDPQEKDGGSMRDGLREAERDDAQTVAGGFPTRTSGLPALSQLIWDVGGFLRMRLRGFLEAVSTLLDIQVTSQVVADSGLGEMEWDLQRRGLGVGGRAEEAFQEETLRRLLNLQEQWGSDPEYSPSASILNLTLYRPSSLAEEWPPGSALALPSWGFLTFGAPLKKLGADPQLVSEFSTQHLQEAAVVSGAWIAQLRALLGLQPTAELQQDGTAGVSCGLPSDSTVCGENCRAQRCAWRVEAADPTDHTAHTVSGQQGDTPNMAFSDAHFALVPSRAVLVAGIGPSERRAGVYLHPSSRGLTEWELGGLTAEAHFRMITEAAKNIYTLHTVLLSGTDLRIAKHVAQAMQGVLNQIQCSLQALRMQQCTTLPAAAKVFLLHSEADTCPTGDSDSAPLLAASDPTSRRASGCGDSRRRSSLRKVAVYRQLALLLARAAVKDSAALLTDGSLEPAPFFSLHFNLAVNVPLLLPFVLPTLVSLIRAVKFAVRK